MKKIKDSYDIGINFGLTSGVITTLGLMIGLNAGTNSRLVVLGGILTIAIADSLSDALGIHISEEGKKQKHSTVWESTIATFLSKFIITLTFAVPILFLALKNAIYTNIVWGLSLLTLLSYRLAKQNKSSALITILEHVGLAIVVIILTHFNGLGIALMFS